MRLRTVRLIQYKRFDNLLIDLGEYPKKVIALVGPNGSGKSSVFDAFEQVLSNTIGFQEDLPPSYHSKSWFDATAPVKTYDRGAAIQIRAVDGSSPNGDTAFYVRSPYRYTPNLRVDSITQRPDIVRSEPRPGSTARIDRRMQGNYERLLGQLLAAYQNGKLTGEQLREQLIGKINVRLARVLDIQISNLGDVTAGNGQLYFEKGTSKDFPFENLSAGEKEVVDLLVDLQVKVPTYKDTVFAIDEPELHLNAAIQRKLLKEIVDLIPDSCQLWVATHSIGFLRALQQDLRGNSQVLDFTSGDFFTGTKTIHPIAGTRADWTRIFATALEDLTGLIAPETIVYCEGKELPGAGGGEEGLDAEVYNTIFAADADTLFVSSGGGGSQARNAAIGLKVLSKAFDSVKLRVLKDRDEATDADRNAFLAKSDANRMLVRREIENYLFDPEILKAYVSAAQGTWDQAAYDALVADIVRQDLKAGQTLQELATLCGFNGTVRDFKVELSSHIVAGTVSYADLRSAIW
jgi:predicted ATPase